LILITIVTHLISLDHNPDPSLNSFPKYKCSIPSLPSHPLPSAPSSPDPQEEATLPPGYTNLLTLAKSPFAGLFMPGEDVNAGVYVGDEEFVARLVRGVSMKEWKRSERIGVPQCLQ